jgi:hypothetical protein
MFHWPMSAGFSRMLTARSSRNSGLLEIRSTIKVLKIRSGTGMFFVRMERGEFSNNSPMAIASFWVRRAVVFRRM